MGGATNMEPQSIDEDETDTMYTELTSIVPQAPFVNTVFVPVKIEELDASSINQMNFDLGEFVEAQAIKIHKIPKQLSINSAQPVDYNHSKETASDVEEENVLSIEEEDLLIKQFLNGELTFSEFTARMDQDVDIEGKESEIRSVIVSKSVTETNTQIHTQKVEKLTRPRPKRSRKNLPAALQGLMGEANLRYARGEVELATQMCMEIIREEPNAPEPFHTSSMIYESDQPDKALQFALIAAYLNPRDSEQWVHLTEYLLQAEKLWQALTCYSKAIQANLENINIVKYAKLLNQHCMQEHMYEIALDEMDNMF